MTVFLLWLRQLLMLMYATYNCKLSLSVTTKVLFAATEMYCNEIFITLSGFSQISRLISGKICFQLDFKNANPLHPKCLVTCDSCLPIMTVV